MATLAKREKVLLGVAGIILLFFLVDRLVCGSGSKRNADKLAPQIQEEVAKIPDTAVPSPKLISKQKSIEIKFPISNWGRDPFLGLPQEAREDTISAKGPYLSFKAISWKDGVAYVLINDIIMKEGEEKNGIQLLQVKKDRIVCRKGGKVFTLTLGEKIELANTKSNNP